MSPPDAYRHGDTKFDPGDLIAQAKRRIARERAAAERRHRPSTIPYIDDLDDDTGDAA